MSNVVKFADHRRRPLRSLPASLPLQATPDLGLQATAIENKLQRLALTNPTAAAYAEAFIEGLLNGVNGPGA